MRCSICIFGESDTDTQALVFIVRSINLSLEKPVKDMVIRPLKRPVILSRNASRKKLKTMSAFIAAVWRAEKTASVEPIMMIHQDCDAVEPAHLEISEATILDLKAAGVDRIVAATAAWEIESWWMLFPEALRAARRCWAEVDYGERNVGKIENAKERLRQDLRPVTKRYECPDYVERDSPTIAEKILLLRLSLTNRKTKSESFDDFYIKVKSQLEDKVFY